VKWHAIDHVESRYFPDGIEAQRFYDNLGKDFAKKLIAFLRGGRLVMHTYGMPEFLSKIPDH
jgi:hypothetical protein